MNSDAAYRFERGVDVEVGPRALERVAQIVIAVAGGSVDGNPIDLRVKGATATQIALRTSRVTQVLGLAISADEIDRNLSGIGFKMLRGDDEHAGAAIPSWRGDVVAETDLIEEIARLHGYDAFPDEIRPFRAGTVPDDPQWLTGRRVRDLLVGHGLYEVRPTPFVAGDDDKHIRLSNPLAANEGHLRREVMESLAAGARYNLAHMQRNIRLFEIGDIFTQSGRGLPLESVHAGVLVMGRRAPRHFTDPGGEDFNGWVEFDRWDVKALAEEICAAAFPGQLIGIEPQSQKEVFDTIMHVEWMIRRGPANIGRIGRVPLDAPIWAPTAWGIEISLGVVDSADVAPRGRHSYRPNELHGDQSGHTPAAVQVRPFRPLPTTPSAEFDLALLLTTAVSSADVERVIRDSGGELLERLELFDQYAGPELGAGRRSVAWRLTFRHPQRTLRDKEIDGRRAKILSALEKELNVRARTS